MWVESNGSSQGGADCRVAWGVGNQDFLTYLLERTVATMKKCGTISIVMVLVIALCAPAALASYVNFSVGNTANMTVSISPTLSFTSVNRTASVEGSSTSPFETAANTVTSSFQGGTITALATGTPTANVLSSLQASNTSDYTNKTATSTSSLSAFAPDSGATVYELASNIIAFKFSLSTPGTYSITLTDPYTYTYQLSQSGPLKFSNVRFTTDIDLAVSGGGGSHSFDPFFDVSVTNDADVTNTGIRTLTLPNLNLTAGQHTVTITTNAQVAGTGSMVPAPSTWLLLGSGLVGLLAFGRRKLHPKK